MASKRKLTVLDSRSFIGTPPHKAVIREGWSADGPRERKSEREKRRRERVAKLIHASLEPVRKITLRGFSPSNYLKVSL